MCSSDLYPRLPVVDLAWEGGGRVGVVGHQELRDAPVDIVRAGEPAAGHRQPRDAVYVFLRLTWDKAGVRALRQCIVRDAAVGRGELRVRFERDEEQWASGR